MLSRTAARAVLSAGGILAASILLMGCAFGETKPATDITDAGATLHGNVRSSGSDDTRYWFEYGQTTAYGNATPQRTIAISDQSAHPVSEPISALAADTAYHFVLCAQDPDQRSSLCGADRTFTTAPDTTPPTVTLADPANGSTIADPTPAFAGSAGTAPGDSDTVTVKVYSGSDAAGTPVETLTATASGGSWSTAASDPLAAGTYTAQAEQGDRVREHRPERGQHVRHRAGRYDRSRGDPHRTG